MVSVSCLSVLAHYAQCRCERYMCIAKIIHGNEISFSTIEDCEIDIRYTNEKLIIDRISGKYLNLLQKIITFIKNIIQRYFFSYLLNIIYL